ncbi:MAG: hypothetical protein ACKVRN_00115 [Pyrinomonadaceae bacterium]
MNKTNLLIVTACLLFLVVGCSKDAEINAFITEFDAATKEIVAKIDANPSAVGIDEAQRAFDARKAGLKEKWDGIKGAVGFQVSADTKKKLEESVAGNMKMLTDVSMKNAMKMAMDKDASAKFKTLLNDYQATFSMEK